VKPLGGFLFIIIAQSLVVVVLLSIQSTVPVYVTSSRPLPYLATDNGG